MPAVRPSPATRQSQLGLPLHEGAAEYATEPGRQVRPDVEIFHKRQVGRVGAPLLHFAIDRLIGAVSQHGVDDGGENDGSEHLHGRLPEHGLPQSAYV